MRLLSLALLTETLNVTALFLLQSRERRLVSARQGGLGRGVRVGRGDKEQVTGEAREMGIREAASQGTHNNLRVAVQEEEMGSWGVRGGSSCTRQPLCAS
ncbi:hypothetical protein E2C01_081055 [Portunus trituberculatus]|uniref:Secreted protein n=1 Tax=Portunus trituberculatus TaxID=210409 RepID=A0A5B7J186_PORTR|nr:hypothetical protein [Portunus trituberculatus]